jgi:acetylornithine deacetylase/succinyl-diaminopimelate desuccinylase-like protein
MKKLFALATSLALCITAVAQTEEVLKIRQYRIANEHSIFREYISFLSIPNIASDTVNLQKNAVFIMDMMKARGIQQVQLLSPVTKGAAPSVYGEITTAGATKTLIFYAHYDGQPVHPSQWAKGLDPFEPQLANGVIGAGGEAIDIVEGSKLDPEWRIYARGASDDKAGVASILHAYDAIIKSGLKPTYNLKFFFEGEEEAGSPHLYEILEKYRSLLRSDLWIICDGPVHQSGKKLVSFGVRGDAHLDLTVYASKRPLHSGHYGNWAPNPAMMLAKLLASMKDDNGRVTVKGFYDDVTPLTAAEKKALQEMPVVDDQMKKELGIIATEYKGKTLVEAIHLPSLNINGMQSANVGKLASNVIPTTATAVLDLRLVPGNDWQRQQQKVIDHIKRQGYYVTDHEPTDEERTKYSKIIKVLLPKDGYNAQRTAMDLPIAQHVINAVKSTTKEQVVLMPTMGGSLPLFLFEKYLGAKTITVPIANHDNNQHAENENIRLQNFWNGMETMAALMMMK